MHVSRASVSARLPRSRPNNCNVKEITNRVQQREKEEYEDAFRYSNCYSCGFNSNSNSSSVRNNDSTSATNCRMAIQILYWVVVCSSFLLLY